MQEKSTVQSVERTFAIIELLSKNKEMSISELSRLSQLHKTTVFRLLNTLMSLGYVYQNEKSEQYGLTYKFLKISSFGLSHHDIRNEMKPLLKELSHKCGETVHLVERNGNNVVYIDKFESNKNSVRMVSRIGMELGMTTTAVGKALLSKCDDDEVLSVWNSSEHTAKTEYTITDFDLFKGEIDRVRLLGYAVDNEENELGVRCVAVALPDCYGEYKYAVSVSAPINRMDEETVKKIAGYLLQIKQ
ncbi:MAG: IclR family transcriptional regulator [Ruminococcaceae bacterium]|nr:IclR family transcriptional regulator [Oscillospiraceae bacterium]